MRIIVGFENSGSVVYTMAKTIVVKKGVIFLFNSDDLTKPDETIDSMQSVKMIRIDDDSPLAQG